jgi:hypothetical protein
MFDANDRVPNQALLGQYVQLQACPVCYSHRGDSMPQLSSAVQDCMICWSSVDQLAATWRFTSCFLFQ